MCCIQHRDGALGNNPHGTTRLGSERSRSNSSSRTSSRIECSSLPVYRWLMAARECTRKHPRGPGVAVVVWPTDEADVPVGRYANGPTLLCPAYGIYAGQYGPVGPC